MTNECRRRTVSMSRVARSMSHKFGAHPSSSILHPSSYILHPLSLLVLILAGLGPGSQTVESEDDLEGLEQRAFQAAVERVAPSVGRGETVGGVGDTGVLRRRASGSLRRWWVSRRSGGWSGPVRSSSARARRPAW